MLVASTNEAVEQGMGLEGLRLKFWVKLDCHIPRMFWQFEYLDEFTVGRLSSYS